MQHIKLPPSSQILTHLSSTVQHYRQNLCQFQQFISLSLAKNNATRSQCSAILGAALARFKDKFLEFRNQWVDELPNVCREFMDIVKKICTLYEQELDRLTKINQKWQFSYHQLVKSTKHSPNPSPNPNKSQRNSLQKQAAVKANQPPSLNSTLSKSLSSTLSSSLQTNLQQMSQILPVCKPKQHQITLMRQQITQLFDEEEDNSQCFVHSRNGKVLKQVKDYGIVNMNCELKIIRFLHLQNFRKSDNLGSRLQMMNHRLLPSHLQKTQIQQQHIALKILRIIVGKIHQAIVNNFGRLYKTTLAMLHRQSLTQLCKSQKQLIVLSKNRNRIVLAKNMRGNQLVRMKDTNNIKQAMKREGKEIDSKES